MNWPVENEEIKEYIHVNNNKVPISLSKKYSFEEADVWSDGAAILIKKPLIILDFDNKTDFESVVKLLEDRGIKTPIMKSDRGGHIWFRTEKQFINKKHFLPILVECDVKAWGITSKGNERIQYAVIKRNGQWREWLQTSTSLEDVAEIPYWLTPSSKAWTKFNLNTDFEEGERNVNLFRLKIPLGISFQFSEEEKKVVLETINDYFLPVSLPQKEIDAMFKTNSEYDELIRKDYETNFFIDNKFQHYKMADYLKTNIYVKKYKSILWCFSDGRYQRGDSYIRTICRKMIPSLKTNQINEVINYLSDICEEEYNRNDIVPYIALNNFIFNTKTLEFIDHTPNIFTPIKLNFNYNPSVVEDHLDICEWVDNKIILDIFANEQLWYDALFEIIGYCLVPHTKAQKVFLFFGEGSNGKSIILEKLIRPMFDGYTSSLSMHDLTDRFKLMLLDEALVNIDSDNSDATLKDTSIFKKVATGDDITVEEKYGKPYTSANTAKMICAFNKLPWTKDNTKGFTRRLMIVPFTKTYSKENGNLDLKLPDKIRERQVIINEYLFLQSLEGLKRLQNNDWHFTNEESDALNKYLGDLDMVRKWITEEELKEKDFWNKPISESYNEFEQWSKDEGYIHPDSKRSFVSKIKGHFNGKLSTKNRSILGQSMKVFCKIDERV